MKVRQIFAAVLLAVLGLPVSAGQPEPNGNRQARDLFFEAPAEIVDGLTDVDRHVMVEYYKHGMNVKVSNRLSQKVGLVSVAPDMIVWSDADSVTTAMAILPAKMAKSTFGKNYSDTIVMIIKTVETPFPDSAIEFYARNWLPIKSKWLSSPQLKDWMKPEARKQIEKVRETIPFILSTASYNPDDCTLIYTNRTSDYYDADEMPEELGLLKPELRYRWNPRTWFTIDPPSCK